MSLPIEFHPSNAKRHSKTLDQISDTILNHLGYPQQCVGEISPDDVKTFILDSASFVSEYKPKIMQKTVPVGSRSGQIISTGIFYPSEWKFGDDTPSPQVRNDVITFINIEPASTVHGETLYNGIVTDEFSFSQMGMGVRLEGQGSVLGQLHSNFDNFLDFQIIYQNIQAGLSVRGREFNWRQDYNQAFAAYYSNLPQRVNRLTITLGLEHTLGNKYYLPDAEEVVGTPVKEYDETVNGTVLYLIQNLALSKSMKKVGTIRNKLKSGLGQFELDGETMIQEANVLEERTIEEIKSGGNLYGWFNDAF